MDAINTITSGGQTGQRERGESYRPLVKVSLSWSDSPMTQKGFLANLSRPLHPLNRQQQPAAQILTRYSTPNTTMVTTSWDRTTTRHRQAADGFLFGWFPGELAGALTQRETDL